jgi:repressor LexA
MIVLTKRQHEVYEFIDRFQREEVYCPSFEEIRAGLGLASLATVHKHIDNMERKGALKRDPNRSRSIELLPLRAKDKKSSKSSDFSLPLLGRVVAGQPLESFPNSETISLSDFTRSRDVYVLQVSGQSMQDEGIMDGDYVLVEKIKSANNGEIVVALVGGYESTLKRFYREGHTIRLQPSNATMQPIIVPADEVQLQGRVVGVLRKY